MLLEARIKVFGTIYRLLPEKVTKSILLLGVDLEPLKEKGNPALSK